MATIRIDVSDETLAAIERERAARGETQSEFVARALNGFLERKRDADADADAYRRNPETEDEIAATTGTQVHAFKGNYLDDGYTQESKRTDVSGETDEMALYTALARYAFEANPWDDGGER